MKSIFERFVKKALLSVLIIHLAFLGYAATYYVSTSGNNVNNGSIGSPWRTLNYACTKAITPGDIIHVNSGTFIETAQCVLAVGVSIEGDGVTSIIKSRVGGSSWNDFTIVLNSVTEGTNGNQHISNLKMDGDALTAYGAIRVLKRSNVEIYNCTFVDFNYAGVAFDGNSRIQPSTYATGNKFHDNIVTNCSGYFPAGTELGDGQYALAINGQQTMLVYNNTMTQTSRPDGNNGYIIKGVSGYNKDVKIYNNILTKKPYNGTGDKWDFAIELWNLQGGIEIYNNTITGSIDLVVASKGAYSYSAWIHDNTIGQSAINYYEKCRGILLEYNISDVIIERNHIKNVTYGIYLQEGLGAKTVSDIRISYNTLDNIGCISYNWIGYGIVFDNSGGKDDRANNINIWNNTIIAATANNTMYGINLPDIGTATNVSVKNNIVKGFTYSPVFGSGTGGATINTLSIENNLFYGNGNNNNVLYTNGLVPGSNTTQNNLTADPLFVSSSDYNLKSTSSLINKGINVGLTKDMLGNSIVGLPDIGAYEYGTATTIADIVKPTVTGFAIPVTSTSQSVSISSFTATDNIGVTGYLLTETSAEPSSGAVGWSASPQTNYTFTTAGAKTLFAWVKDAAGNVSASLNKAVTITLIAADTEKPTVTGFAIPVTSTSQSVSISSFTATDNIGVTGYLLTETSAEPSSGAVGWSASPQTNYTFTTAGAKTLYAWVKDGAGNVSASLSKIVTITIIQPVDLTSHFKTVWQGENGQNHMNLIVVSAISEDLPLSVDDEIAVFSGTSCVGTKKLSQTIDLLNNSSFLTIRASQDDGSSNGYLTSDTIIFKIWDHQNQKEMLAKAVTYLGDLPTWLTTGKYAPGATSVVKLISFEEFTQTIQFIKGNNLFSTYIVPKNPNVSIVMKSISDQGSLSKMQDEAGNSFEYLGSYGGWVNAIGSIEQTEGYNIQAKNNCTLLVTGRVVVTPLEITLTAGWNIISFPQTEQVDALTVIKTLMDQKKLIKVQDEKGNSIEDLKQYGGWVNNIGNFIPGKAYKVNVNASANLTIEQNYPKSAIILAESTGTEYFTTATEGNGSNHMNINIVGLNKSDFSIGDELAAFDGELCVGSLKLTSDHLVRGSASLITSFSTNNSIPNGFKEGHLIQIHSWNKLTGDESNIQSEIINGQMNYEKSASVLIQLKSATTAVDKLSDLVKIDVFPNPSQGKITVRFSQLPDAGSRIDILDIFGRKVVSRIISETSEEFNLDNQPAGLYLIKSILGSEENIQKLVIKK